jgi:hypothetical protein
MQTTTSKGVGGLGQARLLTTNRAAALVLTAGTREDCNTATAEEMLRFRQLQVVVDRRITTFGIPQYSYL